MGRKVSGILGQQRRQNTEEWDFCFGGLRLLGRDHCSICPQLSLIPASPPAENGQERPESFFVS